MAPSKTPGAVRPVTRSAARNVLVCHRAHGAWSWTRAPRRARPYRRRRLFVMPFHREKPGVSDPRSARRRATRPARPRRQVDRVRRAGPFFLTVTSRAATARQIVARLAGVPSASSARLRCDPVAPRSARPGCAGAAPTSGVARAAGRAARLRPSPADAASTAAPTTRSRGTSPQRPRPSSRASLSSRAQFSEIHRIGLHRSSCIGACRSTTTSPSSTRAI